MADRREDGLLLEDDPLWYKDAIIYELHVRSFFDSDADGIGDFAGLTRRLDYLQELGVTALWILPFYPSPLRDDGYDIADYERVNATYGELDDFRLFLQEAHRRGLRVITELVINHTSDQHPWFQRARRSPPGSAERDFYVWSDDPDRYSETRIIFKDFEPSNWTWDPVAEAYYWHRFYHHQPDLNFENPAVQEELFRIMDYWLEMGVDGMRLDAIPYLYEREGTNCENLPETHAFLKKLRTHVDERFSNRMLLAEANQWPEDAAEYFGDGDECHMNFHFPIMPRLFMALRMEDRFPIIDILEQTPEIPETSQWAIFLRNHDELTLEMVTDEERDYMYRVYADDTKARINLGIRRRLAPLLNNNRRKIELMNSLLLSLPGTPVLYYGDEIGMGDNFYLGDRNGVRTPMQWTGDRNAGFSRANPQRLFLPVIIDPEYHYESVNVEAQEENPSSLLWWTRRTLALRQRHRAFGRGDFEWLSPENKRVLAFLRVHEDDTILVVANLSRFAQAVELDLSRFAGSTPVELFGQTRFPRVGELPYLLTLGPHAFYWFTIEAEEAPVRGAAVPGGEAAHALPLVAAASLEEALSPRHREALENALAGHVTGKRWFAGKGRHIRQVEIREVVPLEGGDADGTDGSPPTAVLLDVRYVAEDPETYVVLLDAMEGEEADRFAEEFPGAVVCRLGHDGDGSGPVVHDALARPDAGRRLLRTIARGTTLEGERGALAGVPDQDDILGPEDEVPEPRVGSAEQSNTSVLYGDRWILKLIRRVQEGVSLDREIGRHLTARGFPHTPAVAGALVHLAPGEDGATVGVLQRFVPNQGDAWEYTRDVLGRYYERALASHRDPASLPHPGGGAAEAAGEEIPPAVFEVVEDAYLESMRLLGRRTGEMHVALAGPPGEAAFAPEPFTTLYQRSLYQSMRNLVGRTLRTLEGRIDALPDEVRDGAREILTRKDDLLGRFRQVLDRKMEGSRIRVHGDYHLGQVLFTGKDFVIIDFEGEPARPLSERRLKRSPLRDVAGMLRSIHYAAWSSLFEQRDLGLARPGDHHQLEAWAHLWSEWVSVAFLSGYLAAVEHGPLLPRGAQDRQLLLDVFLLEKAVYELGYELENRPPWTRIPVRGILHLLSDPAHV